MSVPTCEHIKPSGVRCGSPAMRGQQYCFYHVGARACMPRVRAMFHEPSPHLPDAAPMPEFPISFLEDAAAIRIGYMQALYGITSHRLDLRQARLILTALRGASDDLKRMEACVAACAKALPAEKNDGRKRPAADVHSWGSNEWVVESSGRLHRRSKSPAPPGRCCTSRPRASARTRCACPARSAWTRPGGRSAQSP